MVPPKQQNPQLIERRLQSKEKIREQKLIVRLLKVVFVAAFLLPGLDYRLGWSRTSLGAVPLWRELRSPTVQTFITLIFQKTEAVSSRSQVMTGAIHNEGPARDRVWDIAVSRRGDDK